MTERIVIKEKPFPDDLEGRLNAILNVVNTEFKSITLLHLDTEHAYGGSEIRSRINRSICGKEYLPHSKSFVSNCSCTLFPIGMVAQEIILSESDIILETGYKLTKSGLLYGQPIAAFSLNWASENKKSLYEFLRQTQSCNDNRAPLNRVNILKALATKSNLRETDLMEKLSMEQQTVKRSLISLSDVGLISFESIGGNSKRRGSFRYEFIPSDEPFTLESVDVKKEYHIGRPFFLKVYETIKKLGTANSQECAQQMDYEHQLSISRVFNILLKMGRVRVLGWKAGNTLSNVKITDNGRVFLSSFIEPLESALSDGVWINKMNTEYLERMFNDPDTYQEILRKTLRLYSSCSPHVNAKSREARYEQIIDLVSKQREATGKSISRAFNIDLSTSLVLLNQLVKQERLSVRIDEDRMKVYSLRSQE